MFYFFSVALEMGIGTWIAAIFSGLAFVVMFGIASAKGDYKGLIKTTLENDAIQKKHNKTSQGLSK